MNIRWATPEDLRTWYGAHPTMRALVVEDQGDVIGVAGLAFMADHVQAFSAFKEELRSHRFVMGRVAVKFGQMLREYGKVHAVCSPVEPTAQGLLQRLGFKHVGGGLWSS